MILATQPSSYRYFLSAHDSLPLPQTLFNACQDYLHPFGGQVVYVLHEQDAGGKRTGITMRISSPPLWKTALKIVSYFTLILPLLAFALRYLLYHPLEISDLSTPETARGVQIELKAENGTATLPPDTLTPFLENRALISHQTLREGVQVLHRTTLDLSAIPLSHLLSLLTYLKQNETPVPFSLLFNVETSAEMLQLPKLKQRALYERVQQMKPPHSK